MKNSFESLDYQIKDEQINIIEKYTQGLNEDEVSFMRSIFGICDIDIRINSVGTILLNELTDPFYLFQLYSVILWYCTVYYYYASVIIVLTIVSLTISVYETHKNLKKLQKTGTKAPKSGLKNRKFTNICVDKFKKADIMYL